MSWITRPFLDSDRKGLLDLLGVSYTRTRAGGRAGAMRAGGRNRETPTDADEKAKQLAFIEAHRPIWEWLMRHADVELVVDPEERDIIWGWLITSGEQVLHAIGCKRSFTDRKDLRPGEQPASVELVRFMLGQRARIFQVCTLELPQMRARGSGSIGLERPMMWSLDPTWLLTRMVRVAA